MRNGIIWVENRRNVLSHEVHDWYLRTSSYLYEIIDLTPTWDYTYLFQIRFVVAGDYIIILYNILYKKVIRIWSTFLCHNYFLILPNSLWRKRSKINLNWGLGGGSFRGKLHHFFAHGTLPNPVEGLDNDGVLGEHLEVGDLQWMLGTTLLIKRTNEIN